MSYSKKYTYNNPPIVHINDEMFRNISIYLYMYTYILCVCTWRASTHILQSFVGSSTSVSGTPGFKVLGENKGHRWGQRTGLMHLPLWRTKFAGQWQPATHGLLHGPISFQLSQVLAHPGPQVSYTAPCLHWVAGKKKETRVSGGEMATSVQPQPDAIVQAPVTHCPGPSTALIHFCILTKDWPTSDLPQTLWESPAPEKTTSKIHLLV